MKYILLIVAVCLFAKLAEAQKPRARLIARGLKGKVKQITTYQYEKDKDSDLAVPPKKIIENFDINGNQLDETVYDKNGLIKKTRFSYMAGKIIQKEYYNGKLHSTTAQLFDDKGNEIEIDIHSDEDTISDLRMPKMESKSIFKYNNDGNEIEEDNYFGGANLTAKTTLFIIRKIKI